MNTNAIDLDYFIRLHSGNMTETSDHAIEKWDRRAEAWEKDYETFGTFTTDDRIQATVDYLKEHQLLGPDCDVADIGCGPGRFSAAFAKTARSVTGFDLSGRMIHYGTKHILQQGLNNVSFHVCDFQELDLEAEGLIGRFDLAFSSLTPAIQGAEGLKKMMQMSHAFCCDITHINNENQLQSRIMKELFHRERRSFWNGDGFYSLFNILYLLGYYPEVSYYRRHKERWITPDMDYATHFMEFMLPTEERTIENAKRILFWLQENADSEGLVTEISDTLYGRTLWDVRMKTERPEYHPAKGGN